VSRRVSSSLTQLPSPYLPWSPVLLISVLVSVLESFRRVEGRRALCTPTRDLRMQTRTSIRTRTRTLSTRTLSTRTLSRASTAKHGNDGPRPPYGPGTRPGPGPRTRPRHGYAADGYAYGWHAHGRGQASYGWATATTGMGERWGGVEREWERYTPCV